MTQSDRHTTTRSPIGAATRYAFVQSGWHADVVNRGRDAFLAEMTRGGVARDAIDLFEVPGAFEIPLHAKLLARTGRYLGIVACGFVVDGGIYRHEFVADAVIGALMAVQLETEVPVFSAVLTPQQFHEHADHVRFFTEHFVVKGTEVAAACLRTVASLQRVRLLAPAQQSA
jgi:6,7-dimethyl-8-ribityllumazine synthase